MATTVAEPTWAELLGSKDWEGLLDPLDLSLRRLILRCGDFCQATYDAFNNDENSKYAGSSRYGKKSFFSKVMLESASDYQVQCFLYSTAKVGIIEAIFLHSLSREAWDKESNWIGYIATTTDEVSRTLGRREIYVAWRGTTRDYEWIDVFGARPDSAKELLRPGGEDNDDDDEKVPKVMDGWLKLYVSSDPNSPFTKFSARTQLLKKIKELRDLYKNESVSITLTGHSLGAPAGGRQVFNERMRQYPNLKVLQVRNRIDLIPLYPSEFLGYKNTGIPLEIDSRKSPSLKDTKNPSDWHNLQAMLHVVAGWNGPQEEFELKVKRSLALVNKSSSILKDEYLIPGSWWVEKNKGLVRDENGEWTWPAPDEDQPVPEF
ncbi:UNVERIFIED_CONTAM: Phospholipase A1-IIdelta [Sesamum radiatum]|uniref:Phospholipase A1 n=1 Tax=Sesamum radiatum TaxID=300843 RepID=A0AAW2KIZ2_SESRA